MEKRDRGYLKYNNESRVNDTIKKYDLFVNLQMKIIMVIQMNKQKLLSRC